MPGLVTHLRVPLPIGLAVVLSLPIFAGTSAPAIAQAYTYDPPACGGTYREERAKPQQLRLTWEMSSGQECVQQNKFPLACRHFQAALAAADRMEPEAGSPEGIKSYLKTMMKTHGCP